MADVFLSYSKEFRSLTESAAHFLESQGFSVWWDTSLVGGDVYHKVIVAEIKACKAAVVIWTPASIQSDWVYSEATRAHRRKKLVPVKVADLDVDDIPAPFDALHVIDYDKKDDWTSAILKLAGTPVGGSAPEPTANAPATVTRARSLWSWLWPAPRPPTAPPRATPGRKAAGIDGWRRIFISYRRGDSVSARIIRDMLRGHFAQAMVFMDIENIAPGIDFAQEIRNRVNESDATLVIIGPEWASARNERGQPRIKDHNDFVAQEIALALDSGKPIIPVLVNGARLPKVSELPHSIADLANRNAYVVRPEHFHEDMERLIKTFHAWSDDD
jgi:hypothetical protein